MQTTAIINVNFCNPTDCCIAADVAAEYITSTCYEI